MGHHPDPNAQCANIARLQHEYEAAGEAVMSMDTKKKALLGNVHRAGTTFTAETIATFDHDVGAAGEGKLIPHGLYDMVNQHAHIHLNTSHDTSELWCDRVALWWERAGQAAYPQASCGSGRAWTAGSLSWEAMLTDGPPWMPCMHL